MSALNPRIIAGNFRGVRLDVADGTRPLTDRIKQSLFDLIAAELPGARVLDVFAGSGSFGLEAISRGAEYAQFVDSSDEVCANLERIIVKLGLEQSSNVYLGKLQNYLLAWKKKAGQPFDIVFLDPPFPTAGFLRVHELGQLLTEEGLLIIRLPLTADLPAKTLAPFTQIHRENYGDSKVLFFRPRSNSA